MPGESFRFGPFPVDHREALLEALWPGANVTDNALGQAVSERRHVRMPNTLISIAGHIVVMQPLVGRSAVEANRQSGSNWRRLGTPHFHSSIWSSASCRMCIVP
jgi:hypothetical protein